MQNIRHAVFETNSSSTHSISISHDVKTFDTLPLNDDGNLEVEFGEFGWEEETYHGAFNKLCYAATWVFEWSDKGSYPDAGKFKKYKTMLETVLKEQTGAREIIFKPLNTNEDAWNPYGYVDHQSMDDGLGGEMLEAFESLTSLRDFIFNPASWFETDNDNH